jgi:ABC-2 type transport system permease protein
MTTSPSTVGWMMPTDVEAAFGPTKHLRDFWWLLRGELFLLREEWFWYLVQGSFVPLANLLFLWLLVGRRDPAAMTDFVIGSLVMGLSLGGMLSLGQQLGWLKQANAFEYYAALPIAKGIFLAALTTRGTLLALPSAAIILAVGRLLYGLAVPALALLVLLLAAYALAGFGAIIGFWAPTARLASLATPIGQPVINLFGPLYYPAAVLPAPLQLAAHLWPTTYAAVALRGAVGGAPAAQLWPPIVMLAGFAGLSLVLVPRQLAWRRR